MSIQEIRREIQKELPYLIRSGRQKTGQLIRTRIKKRLPNIRGSFYVNSPQRTRWLIIIECPKNMPPLFLLIALYKDGNKTKAIQVDPEPNGELTIISDHFFHRYAERFGIQGSRMEEVISRYFQSNANFAISQNGDQTAFSFPDGYGLGYFDEINRVYYINTYLSTPMLFESQTIQREAAMENLKEQVNEIFPEKVSLCKLLNGEDVGSAPVYRPKQAG